MAGRCPVDRPPCRAAAPSRGSSVRRAHGSRPLLGSRARWLAVAGREGAGEESILVMHGQLDPRLGPDACDDDLFVPEARAVFGGAASGGARRARKRAPRPKRPARARGGGRCAGRGCRDAVASARGEDDDVGLRRARPLRALHRARRRGLPDHPAPRGAAAVPCRMRGGPPALRVALRRAAGAHAPRRVRLFRGRSRGDEGAGPDDVRGGRARLRRAVGGLALAPRGHTGTRARAAGAVSEASLRVRPGDDDAKGRATSCPSPSAVRQQSGARDGLPSRPTNAATFLARRACIPKPPGRWRRRP